MADNQYYISAGFVPNDNGSDAGNHYYIAAGLVPMDTPVESETARPFQVIIFQTD